ncbi:cytochrome P450 [Dactylosporangium fulvum]|uniref:Cytochrome P450 n=1 Tax=Dactylosporangium fulvum TaxID=53359 RepID=A0ABY5VWA1_9ACTN|nr:cytochrome P450 [Dactylosporangium fulvum]UWP80066.1 cytochrome P450 [Dactylosporangium fulvum]
MTATLQPSPTRAPGRLPLLGHMHRLLADPRAFFRSLHGSGDDVVVIRLGPTPAYVINDRALVHQILTKDVRRLDKGLAYEKSAPFLGDGLLNSTEPTHMAHRRLMQPAFHQTQIARYVEQMREAAATRAEGWRDGQRIEMDQEIHAFAVAVVCRALFSSNLGDTVAVDVEESLPILLKGVTRRIALPVRWLEKLPTPGNRRFDTARQRLADSLGDVIEEYRQRGVDHGDLMAILLEARAEDGGPGLTDQQVHDEAMALFLGGVETARDVLSWAFHLLSRHPEVQRRIAAEVDAVLQDRPLGYETLRELRYVRQVITETLRLYPPAWLLTRRTVTELELGGHVIPPDSNVLFSVHAIQRDPVVYPEPDAFDPDRWREPTTPALLRTAFLPFGAGNRSCIGEPFAWAEMVVFVATVARRWSVHAVPGHPIRPARSPMLQPRDLPLIVRARRVPK